MKLSVIIPVYNSKNNLKELFESILSAKLDNQIEVILVDDGSTDGSSELCDTLADQDERCSVIHKTNGGVSSARNAGLFAAKGEYIFFCDSDDIVNTATLSEAITLLEKIKADVFIFDFHYNFLTENRIVKSAFTLPEYQCLSKGDIIHYIIKPLTLGAGTDLASSCHKIFKKEIINNSSIVFEEKIYKGEDWRFVLEFLSVADSAFYYPKPLYEYRIDGSQTESKYKKISGVHLLGSTKTKLLFNKKYDLGASREKIVHWYDSLIDTIVWSVKNEISASELIEMLEDESVREATLELKKLKNEEYLHFEISRKHKLYAWLINLKMRHMLKFFIWRME